MNELIKLIPEGKTLEDLRKNYKVSDLDVLEENFLQFIDALRNEKDPDLNQIMDYVLGFGIAAKEPLNEETYIYSVHYVNSLFVANSIDYCKEFTLEIINAYTLLIKYLEDKKEKYSDLISEITGQIIGGISDEFLDDSQEVRDNLASIESVIHNSYPCLNDQDNFNKSLFYIAYAYYLITIDKKDLIIPMNYNIVTALLTLHPLRDMDKEFAVAILTTYNVLERLLNEEDIKQLAGLVECVKALAAK